MVTPITIFTNIYIHFRSAAVTTFSLLIKMKLLKSASGNTGNCEIDSFILISQK